MVAAAKRQFVLALLIALVVGGGTACGAASTSGHDDDHARVDESTTINGEVPPGVPGASASSVIVLRQDTGTGRELVISRTTRAMGTRAPIHVHDAGGTTCVESGQVTILMDGASPHVVNAGDCYYMPADTPMTAYASGDTDVVMLDMFEVPLGEDVWHVLEPGQDAAQTQFGGP